MDSTRSRSLKSTSSNQKVPKKPATTQPTPVNKKRKAEDETPAEENKENSERPSTPPLNDSELAHLPNYERTPGRVGPIKPENHDLKPDIKPFKGPKGKKVRKTFWEKEKEYGQFCKDNEEHPFHELHVCFDKGPKGSPTYDKSGFELDWHAVAHWMEPTVYNKSKIMRGMDHAINKSQEDRKKMAAIFFEKGEAPEEPEYCGSEGYWKDRVSKDLNVPWHKIKVEHFQEWEKLGFKKARKGEYENPSDLERKRMLRLLSGASLRK